MSVKLCECGCQQPTKIASRTNRAREWVKGEPMRFLNFHQGRTSWPLERYEIRPDGCWLWTGLLDAEGYGQCWHDSRVMRAHKLFYERFVEPVPEGLELHHECRSRSCVNPGHLRAVTRSEHARLSVNASKTHCANGHEFDEANTYRCPNGRRVCRACNQQRTRAYRQRKAAARMEEAA